MKILCNYSSQCITKKLLFDDALIMMWLVQTTSSRAFESDQSFVTLKMLLTATVTIDLKTQYHAEETHKPKKMLAE